MIKSHVLYQLSYEPMTLVGVGLTRAQRYYIIPILQNRSPYSTVTDLAKLRGRSTLHPRNRAIW